MAIFPFYYLETRWREQWGEKEGTGSGNVTSFVHMITKAPTKKYKSTWHDSWNSWPTNKIYTILKSVSILHAFTLQRQFRNDQGSLSSLQYLCKIAPKESWQKTWPLQTLPIEVPPSAITLRICDPLFWSSYSDNMGRKHHKVIIETEPLGYVRNLRKIYSFFKRALAEIPSNHNHKSL